MPTVQRSKGLPLLCQAWIHITRQSDLQRLPAVWHQRGFCMWKDSALSVLDTASCSAASAVSLYHVVCMENTILPGKVLFSVVRSSVCSLSLRIQIPLLIPVRVEDNLVLPIIYKVRTFYFWGLSQLSKSYLETFWECSVHTDVLQVTGLPYLLSAPVFTVQREILLFPLTPDLLGMILAYCLTLCSLS